MLRFLLALLLGLLPALAFPQVQGDNSPPVFRDSFEEARFRTLTHELRCVMCQNQSLADSNAEIARDLRNEVLVLIRQGKTDAEVRDFMVSRYGEFVLYKPRMGGHTLLLWLAPLLLLAGAGIAIALWIRRQNRQARIPLDENQEW